MIFLHPTFFMMPQAHDMWAQTMELWDECILPWMTLKISRARAEESCQGALKMLSLSDCPPVEALQPG